MCKHEKKALKEKRQHAKQTKQTNKKSGLGFLGKHLRTQSEACIFKI